MKKVSFALALLGLNVAFAAEPQVAGQLQEVRVVSVKLTNEHVYKNLGITNYDIIATVESSNSCMVPSAFVSEEQKTGSKIDYKLSGVYNQVCTADFDPVTTEVLVGTYVKEDSSAGAKAQNEVSVNSISAQK